MEEASRMFDQATKCKPDFDEEFIIFRYKKIISE